MREEKQTPSCPQNHRVVFTYVQWCLRYRRYFKVTAQRKMEKPPHRKTSQLPLLKWCFFVFFFCLSTSPFTSSDLKSHRGAAGRQRAATLTSRPDPAGPGNHHLKQEQQKNHSHSRIEREKVVGDSAGSVPTRLQFGGQTLNPDTKMTCSGRSRALKGLGHRERASSPELLSSPAPRASERPSLASSLPRFAQLPVQNLAASSRAPAPRALCVK